MSEMIKVKIGEHIKITPGYPFNSEFFNTNGDGIGLIRIRDLLQSKIETYYQGEFTNEFLISENDILVGMDGDFHIVKWKNKQRALLNQRIMKISQREGALIDVRYFYFYLIPFLKEVWDKTTATTVKHLSTFNISNAVKEFPSLHNQRITAQILTTCDTFIEQTQSAIAKYKAIKQGLLHDLFTRGLDSNGKLRPNYQDSPELYKESELGMIPKEWEVKRFGDFVNLIHGFQFRDYDFTENGIPIVKIGQIKPENVDLSNCSFISKDRIDEFKSIIIRNGDVLMALTGATLGKACQVKKLENDVLQNYRVGRFEPKNLDEIHKGFLYYTLTTRQFLNQVFSKVNAGAQGNIGKSDFEKPIFKMPDFNEQLRIFNRLESLNHKIDSEETIVQKYQSIKRGLMGDLLGGRKEVKTLIITD